MVVTNSTDSRERSTDTESAARTAERAVLPSTSEMKTVVEGLGFFSLGFLGFLVSFWFAGKVKAVVGIATLFGAGMIGYGLFRTIFGERYPALAWLMAVVFACLGLVVTLLCLYLILGAEFM